MKSLVAFFAAIVLVAAGSSFVTLRLAAPHKGSADSHAWLHDELHLGPQQLKALEPIEARFAVREARLQEEMREANRELAAAIAAGRSNSPEVAAAVAKVHQRMGELQKASIDHIFEMREVLTPEQGKRLIELAQRALEEAP